MGDYSKTFDWVQFPEGRARFSGGIRGGDERGHETFAVEVDGVPYYGEIDQTFLPDRHNFNIEILSFGYGDRENVANPSPGARRVFAAHTLKTVQALVVELVRSGLDLDDRPFILGELPNSKFQGKVTFCDGWAREKMGEGIALSHAMSIEVAR